MAHVIAPLHVKNLISGGLPMVETKHLVIVMKQPVAFEAIESNIKVQVNNDLVFFCNGSQISVKTTALK